MAEIEVVHWPDTPEKAHEHDPKLNADRELVWRPPDGHWPFNWCSYCGSIHPADLLHLISEKQVTLGGSDWKYGWPHKFYLHGINGWRAHGKWYNQHLEDLGDDAFAAVAAVLEEHAHIRFSRSDKGLKYEAPYAGYQRIVTNSS